MIAESATKATAARREVNIPKLMVRSCAVEKTSWEMRPAQTKEKVSMKKKGQLNGEYDRRDN
jgi:hypothetical protein